MRSGFRRIPPDAVGLTLFLFSLGSLALALPWLSGVVTIPWDAKAHFYAQVQFLANSLHTGQSPFWNPYVFAGSPQIADPQSQIFSPPFLLLAWANPSPGFEAVDAVTFLMLWAGGTGTILYCLDRGWHPAGALVAGFAFANGGSAAWRIQHTGEVISFCWFGLTLWLLARALDRRSILWGLAAGLTAAMMVLGRDQVAYLAGLVLTGYVIWRIVAVRDARGAIRQFAGPLAVAALTGLVLVSVPLAMTIALAGSSSRVDIGFQGAAGGSLPPVSFLTLAVANLFGVDGPLKDYWGPPTSSVWGDNGIALARNMTALYAGAIPLAAFVMFGFVRRALGSHKVRYLVVALAAMVLFALGSYTPFFSLVWHLPGISLFRRPADATFLIGGLFALLAGYCVHRAMMDRESPTRTRSAVQFAALVFPLVLCGLVAFDRGRLDQALPALGLAAGLLAVAGLVLVAAPPLARRNFTVAMFLVAVAMIVDLGVSNGPNESTGLPPEQYEVLRPGTRNDTIEFLRNRLSAPAERDRRDRVELAAIGFDWPNSGMVHRFDHWLGYNPIVSRDFSMATGAIDQVAVPDQRKFAPLFPNYRSIMADLLGVRWIATGVPAGQLDHSLQPGDLVEVARTRDAWIYENPGALPRVLLATRAVRADFDEMIRTGIWPDVDYRRTVLLPNPEPADLAARSAGTRQPPRPDRPGSTVQIESYANTRVVIDADAPEGGFVVLNDAWHPWWTASVDGEPAEIHRANVLFRAVRIPPGQHRVEFRFRPFEGLLKQVRALF